MPSVQEGRWRRGTGIACWGSGGSSRPGTERDGGEKEQQANTAVCAALLLRERPYPKLRADIRGSSPSLSLSVNVHFRHFSSLKAFLFQEALG